MKPAIRDQIDRLAGKLARDLVAIVDRHVGERVTSARAAALGFMHQEIDDMFTAPAVDDMAPEQPEVVHPEPAPSEPVVDEIDDQVEEVVHRDLKPEKSPRRCSSCKEIGHRADRCPERDVSPANVIVPPTPTSPPPHQCRPCRSLRCDRGGRRAPPSHRRDGRLTSIASRN